MYYYIRSIQIDRYDLHVPYPSFRSLPHFESLENPYLLQKIILRAIIHNHQSSGSQKDHSNDDDHPRSNVVFETCTILAHFYTKVNFASNYYEKYAKE